MSDSCNTENQGISGAVPGNNNPKKGIGLNVNEDALKNTIFNPNNLLSAVQTYKVLNNVANKMFGLEARWFRAVPQQRSKDVIFQEYTLSQVEEEPICLNVLLPTGQSIESKYNYDLMGLEYELPFEVNIDKMYWEEMAGYGTAPQKKDIVYLVMANKLFQVESSYLKRGFMEQETHWVINLRKYSQEASRKESEALQDTIDQYTVGEEELFGDMIKDDIEKIVDKKQMDPANSTTKDKYKEISKTLQTINYDLKIGGITVAESIYDLSTSDEKISINYKNSQDKIDKNNSRSILAWFNPKKTNTKKYLVTKIIPDSTITYPANFKIYIKGNHKFAKGDVLTVHKTDIQTFYGTIIDDTYSMNGIYFIKIEQDVLDNMDSIQTKWYLTKGWKASVKSNINILSSIGEKDKFKVNIISNKFIQVEYGQKINIFSLETAIKDGTWYGIVVNFGNAWNQLNVNLWTPSLTDLENKLESVYFKTISIEPADIELDKYYINASESYLTNIRLFNQTIEEEKQSNELLSYFTVNGDYGLILDNADQKLTIPYISKQR